MDDTIDKALRELYRADVPDAFHQNWHSAVMREELNTMNKKNENRMNWKRFWRVTAPAAAALVLVIGAGWVGAREAGMTSAPQMPAPQMAVSRSGSTSTNYKATSSANGGYAMMASESYDTQANADTAAYGAAAATGGAEGGTVAPEAADSRKLVRTANLTLRTAAFDEDLNNIQTLLNQMGGYMENVYQSGDREAGNTRTVDMTLRVPSDQLEVFLTGLNGIGRVVSRNESVTDMTVQYADNAARLNTLREKLDRLNELLTKAENVADIVEIESAISDTQYQIDSYETSQRSIDRQADMSQVYLTMTEDSPVAVTSEMGMGERLSAALKTSVDGLGRFLRNMLVFIVMALPVLIPIAILAVVIILLRQHKVKQKAKKPEQPGEDE